MLPRASAYCRAPCCHLRPGRLPPNPPSRRSCGAKRWWHRCRGQHDAAIGDLAQRHMRHGLHGGTAHSQRHTQCLGTRDVGGRDVVDMSHGPAQLRIRLGLVNPPERAQQVRHGVVVDQVLVASRTRSWSRRAKGPCAARDQTPDRKGCPPLPGRGRPRDCRRLIGRGTCGRDCGARSWRRRAGCRGHSAYTFLTQLGNKWAPRHRPAWLAPRYLRPCTLREQSVRATWDYFAAAKGFSEASATLFQTRCGRIKVI